jgi:hypothetical protein
LHTRSAVHKINALCTHRRAHRAFAIIDVGGRGRFSFDEFLQQLKPLLLFIEEANDGMPPQDHHTGDVSWQRGSDALRSTTCDSCCACSA